jgi:hypothetical protein
VTEERRKQSRYKASPNGGMAGGYAQLEQVNERASFWMDQPSQVRDSGIEEATRVVSTGARKGFVGAFVRSVRRGPQSSAVGKIAVGVLVVVLAAGSVVGLSVLLRGTGKLSNPQSAPTVAASDVGRGTGSPGASAPAVGPGQSRVGVPGAPGIGGGPQAPDLSRLPRVPGLPGAPDTPGTSVANATIAAESVTSGNATSGGPTGVSNTGTTSTTAATAPKEAIAKQGPSVLRGPTQIVGYGSNRCVDVTDGKSGNQLQIYACTGGDANQRWIFYSDETVRALGGCMTASSMANGAAVKLGSCPKAGTKPPSSQKFVLNSAHDLTSYDPTAGIAKCVDAKDMGTTNSTKLQLWSCGGTSNQKWHV